MHPVFPFYYLVSGIILPNLVLGFNDQITLIYSIIPFPSTSFSQDISLYHCIKAMIPSLNLFSILPLDQKLKIRILGECLDTVEIFF